MKLTFLVVALLAFSLTNAQDEMTTESTESTGPEFETRAGVSLRQFRQMLVDCQNQYRGVHQAPNFVISHTINQVAQNWANTLLASGKFEHSHNPNYGENIYMSSDENAAPDGACKLWYGEVEDYDYNNPGFSSKTGHFTQLVWVNSKKIGCGMAHKEGSQVVVCNYDPPGNYEGQYKENVLPPKNQ